jgi:iron complex outermembrane recepter protein
MKLSGHVQDDDTKENLIRATVMLKETGQQLITDEKGDFVFANLCKGTYTLLVTHVSCDSLVKTVVLAKDLHVDVLLPHARNTLGEVTVEAQKAVANTGFKKQLSGKDLEETRGLSLAEALSRINGVTMLQTGSAISKPVIHGLHSNRILTINNGIRQEGQQWGNEHAPEIDPFIADKLTVIKGVDELRYGSDAIGGVILVETKPLRNMGGYSAEFNTGYFSNNRQYVVSGVWEQQLKKTPAFRYRLQGTFKKGANATTPGYRLNNTGNEEANFSVTAGWKKERINTELFYSQFATKVGIFTGAHIGNLTDLLLAIAADKPNDVFLGEQTYRLKRPYQDVAHRLLKIKSQFTKGAHKFNLLLGGQFNRRKEYDIVRSGNNTKAQLDLSINTFTQDISWEQPKKNNFSGVAGLSLMQQQNNYRGRYFIPNYFAFTFGGYFIEKWQQHDWELQAGIRYDNKSINTTRLKFNSDTINYDFNFSTLAASLNAVYKATEKTKFNLNIGLANRAPHVNELLSDGIHHGTATYEKGDIALKPEKAVNISAGMSLQNKPGTVLLDVLLYANAINNFIYQQPRPENPVLTIAGAFPLIEYRQTNALLTGFDIAASFKPVSMLEWQSKVSVLYARNQSLNDWLILMPANRVSNELTYSFKNGDRFADSYFSAEYLQVFRQKNIPSDRNGKQDYKVPPAGYGLLNFNAATNFAAGKTKITLGITVKNVLNTVYRDYLNSMRYFTDEVGRNIGVRLKIPINNASQ